VTEFFRKECDDNASRSSEKARLVTLRERLKESKEPASNRSKGKR